MASRSRPSAHTGGKNLVAQTDKTSRQGALSCFSLAIFPSRRLVSPGLLCPISDYECVSREGQAILRAIDTRLKQRRRCATSERLPPSTDRASDSVAGNDWGQTLVGVEAQVGRLRPNLRYPISHRNFSKVPVAIETQWGTAARIPTGHL